MRYYALAADYDGTLARAGQVEPSTVEALGRLRQSGRRLVLVTGRELEDIVRVFPQLDLFDLAVVENGAVLYNPKTKTEKLLAEAPAPEFAQALRNRGVGPVGEGRVVVATWVPHEKTVLEVIRQMGLELQVIFNKGAVMVLPTGVNKATGLVRALEELGLSPHNVVGVGDAENDHAFLRICECSAAVANALPAIKERVDFVAERDHGAGVAELIERLVASDLAEFAPRQERHELALGTCADGREFRLRPYGINVLVSGGLGGGKSTLATTFLEQLSARGRQFCLLDPEGDYEEFEPAIILGRGHRAPLVGEVLEVLRKPGSNAIVNLLGIPLNHRPAFFEGLVPALAELRAATGRPHWIVVDEIHHLVPAEWGRALFAGPADWQGMMLITAFPDRVAKEMLSAVDLILGVGEHPDEAIVTFSRTLGEPAPEIPDGRPSSKAALAWDPGHAVPRWFQANSPQTQRARHHRKYAEGELKPEDSFYFRGADNRLSLRAQNLMVFLQMAEGVDDETWMHHLRRHDYSRWFREVIHDDELARQAEQVESQADASPRQSRVQIAEKVRAKYAA